ncbi:MAG: DNA topoisomerase (ATP-hydrolyzing) [Christensenellales bacterium]
MDEKENQHKSNNVLPGQVRYDELLSSMPREEEHSQSVSSQKIDGQIDFSQLLLDLDARLKQSEDALNHESTKPKERPPKESREQKAEREQKEKDMVNDFEQQKRDMQKQINQKVESRTKIKKEEEKDMSDEFKNEEIVEESQEKDTSSVMSLPPRSSDGMFEKSIDEVLHDSMIPYTEHVVLDRALPRVEDGLKPVQRRILYSMLELGVTPDKPFRKSARIVGDCMGKYHPHGDSSVYDAMVRMSQDFSMSAPLIWGHGNFGSVDGDGAAAMRYTEAKLQPLAMELLRDIEKNTIRWGLNFDDTLKEPDILPGRFPNLLVNGAYGIAVGLATNIPPHNLGEVIDGTVAYIDNNKISLDEMMKYIPAPDFPTGAQITAGDDIVNAYRTGKGKLIIRAKCHLESKGDKRELVFTEIPYQQNKAAILQKIAELKTDGKNPLADISEIRDESDREGMRAVIRLKKEANPKEVLEYLYKSTNLQTSFSINMFAIAGGKPKLMGLLDIISYYVEYQREVIYKRTKFDYDATKDRAHIVEGLLIAIKNIDEVIKIIKKSSTTADAKSKLKDRFLLSERQAQAILDMRLARLVNLEVEKLELELKELKELIKRLSEILNSKKLQFEIIKKELLEIKNKYAVPRRSEIIKSLEIKQLKVEDESAYQKDVFIGVTAANNVKNIAAKNYSMAQKEITDSSCANDIHTVLVATKSKKRVLMFTENGNCIKTDVNKIPEAKWRDKGTPIKNIESNADNNDKIISIIEIPENTDNLQILFMTKMGMVKLSNFEDIVINKGCYQAVKLKEGDRVLSVETKTKDGSIIMLSKTGMVLNMSKTDIPTQGRISTGVIGMSLEQKDEVVHAAQINSDNVLVIMTNKGFVKKVLCSEFDILPRNRKGLRAIALGENGKEVLFGQIYDTNKIIAVRTQSGLMSVATRSIEVEGRYTKGTQKVKQKIEEVYNYNR